MTGFVGSRRGQGASLVSFFCFLFDGSSLGRRAESVAPAMISAEVAPEQTPFHRGQTIRPHILTAARALVERPESS